MIFLTFRKIPILRWMVMEGVARNQTISKIVFIHYYHYQDDININQFIHSFNLHINCTIGCGSSPYFVVNCGQSFCHNFPASQLVGIHVKSH